MLLTRSRPTRNSYIRISETQSQAFTTRFALHLEWDDPYYKLKVQPDNPKDIIHFSNYPGVGRPCRNFPTKAASIRGVEIDTNGLPRWTPEITFLDTEHQPTIIREEYAADRQTGIVTCYMEGTGNFAHDHEISRNKQTLKWSICSHHRLHTLEFVEHDKKKSKVCKSPFSEWSFDEKKELVPNLKETIEGEIPPKLDGDNRRRAEERGHHKVSFDISAKRNLKPIYIRVPLQAVDFARSELKVPFGLITTALWAFMRNRGVCSTPVVGRVLELCDWCVPAQAQGSQWGWALLLAKVYPM